MIRVIPPRIVLAVTGRAGWIVGLALGLAATGELFLRFGGTATAVASLVDVTLLVVPLVGLVAGTARVHQARELIELLLVQPVSRGLLFAVLFGGTALPLVAAVGVGVLAPFAWHGLVDLPALGVAASGALLAVIATSLAFVIALAVDDRARALGVALVLWLVAAVGWDGLLLLVATVFGHRPVEIPLLVALALNPLDVLRVLLLLGTDAAVLLGYTGAVVQRTLGAGTGRLVLGATLTLWTVVPVWLAARRFSRKDF